MSIYGTISKPSNLSVWSLKMGEIRLLHPPFPSFCPCLTMPGISKQFVYK